MLQQIENAQTIPFRELHMIGILDDGLGSKQGMSKDEVCQVSVVQGDRSQKQRFFLGANP